MHPDVSYRAERAVVVVGNGRGFVIEGAHGRLIVTAARCFGRGSLCVRDEAAQLKAAMPGSPIVTDAGVAIGVVASVEAEEQGGPVEQPVLVDHLPGWLLRDLGLVGAREA